MKLMARKALGVDISDGAINLALLRRSAAEIELVKAASGPIPDGAIEDGRIADSAALGRAIRELKNRNRMHARKAAVSLSVSPVLANVLEIPDGSPRNVRQHIRDELKSYVVLSGSEIAFDFCRIGSGQGSGARLLAVAADDQAVAELFRTCIRAGLNIEAVEPKMLAYIRALYTARIEGRFDCDVLIGLLYDDSLTLCVFRKCTLDLVRVEDITAEKTDPDELCRRIAREMNTIVQSYTVETPGSSRGWEITLFGDLMHLPDGAEGLLRAEVPGADLQVISGADVFQDMIARRKGRQERPSALAVSLAMGLLNVCETGLRLNLVPPESAEVRSVKKQLALTTAVVFLVIPLLAFLAAKGFSLLTSNVQTRIEQKEQTDESHDAASLLREQERLERKIALLSESNGLKAILDSGKTLDWTGILTAVKECTPKDVRITALYKKGKSEMGLEGLALSYEAARFFVTKLNESEYISLASLNEAKKEDAADGFVSYVINCTLTNKKGES